MARTRVSSGEKLGKAKPALCSADASWHTILCRAKKYSKNPLPLEEIIFLVHASLGLRTNQISMPMPQEEK